MIFIQQHSEFLIRMIQGEVDFIIIGGYAVIYHGYVRSTGDLDIWIKPDNMNKQRLLTVLRDLGISEESVNKVANLDFTVPVAFHYGSLPYRIDFLTNITSVDFESAAQRVVYLELPGFHIPFLHFNDLILSKLTSDRAKDKADVEELQKIQKRKS